MVTYWQKLPIADTWSDGNPTVDEDVKSKDGSYYKNKYRRLFQLRCTCGCNRFEVLSVSDQYETLAWCNRCGKYYIVHSG